MNPKSCLATSLALGVLLLPVAASAQRPQRAPQTTTLAAGIQRGWSGVKRNLTEAAANMPEEHYLLEPNPEIRNFGELFGHVANAQFRACAAAKGEANPNQGKDQELLNKSKAEFVAALTASFAYCDPVYLALTDQSAVELVKQGNNMVARGYLLANNVAHSNEMYGTSAVYMRLANMVPPSTERRTRSRPR
jgi:hypothetical protein